MTDHYITNHNQLCKGCPARMKVEGQYLCFMRGIELDRQSAYHNVNNCEDYRVLRIRELRQQSQQEQGDSAIESSFIHTSPADTPITGGKDLYFDGRRITEADYVYIQQKIRESSGRGLQ